MPRIRVGPALAIGLQILSTGCAWFETTAAEDTFEAARVRSGLMVVDGNGQTGVTNSGLANPLIVKYLRIKDTTPKPDTTTAPDVVIDWSVEQGAGSLGNARTSTDASGKSENTWVLGPGTGTQTVKATVNGTSVSVTFSATAGSPPPPPPPPPPGIASVTVSPSAPTVQVQQTAQLTASVALEAGATGTPTIAWTSADETKATVVGTGTTATVTGKAAGDVAIKAKATLGTSTGEGTATVHVVAAPKPITVRVVVNGSGTGSGQVTSTGIPGGNLACTITSGNRSGTCEVSFTDEDGKGSVSLSAVAGGNSTFEGWTGCGQGSSGATCVLPFDATDDVTLTATARFEPQSAGPILGVDEMIVFANDADGEFAPSPSQIWVMTNNSTVAVTSGNGINTEPTWSPDGSQIVFRTKRVEPKGDIWIMNADGTGAALLTGSVDFDHDPDWSSTNKVIWVSDRTGSDEVYVVDVSNPNMVVQLTTTFGIDELDPTFSPDGSMIAYVQDDFSGRTRIYVMNADGTGQTRLTDGAEDEDPSWSPDGTKIVFTRNNQLWTINVNGTGLTQLTSGANDGSPVFSPDGTKIAFARGPTNAKRLYVLFLGSPPAPQPLGPALPGESEDLDWIRRP